MPITHARLLSLTCGLALAGALVLPVAAAWAQSAANVQQVTPHQGEMFATLPAPEDATATRETLRFEPWELIEEMFLRDDVVWVMRHGPTDWSKLDVKGVAPTDCANQRVLSAKGRDDMRTLGVILAENDVLPGKVVVSEWCRNQQTVAALLEGAESVEPGYAARIAVETDPDLNLLLALQGAPSVKEMRELVSNWSGEGADGPLLVVTHFTNIEEMLDFSVYEGEILVVDPERDNRVLGYLRLRSAASDIGHFRAE